jgi:hypothetical protein
MTSKRWNIFARELEDILALRGLKLTHLDDRANIYPRKVARLRESLHRPKSFPVLNREEMERISVAFRLNSDEILRLHAAILTAAIEKTLMDHIGQDAALLAAEQIFLVILGAIFRHGKSMFDLSTIPSEQSSEEAPRNESLGRALALIDLAAMALYLSDTQAHSDQLIYAKQAYKGFKSAIKELESISQHSNKDTLWIKIMEEAKKGFDTAKKQLEILS